MSSENNNLVPVTINAPTDWIDQIEAIASEHGCATDEVWLAILVSFFQMDDARERAVAWQNQRA